MIINKKYLSKYSVLPIPSNYNYDEVMSFVDLAEKIWIVQLIGASQYDELQEQVDENNLTEENSTLLVEAIYPYLAMAVCYEALPSLLYHVSEVSITKGFSDNSQALTLKEITYYESWIRRQLEARKDFAIEWIRDHIQYYPLIAQCKGCQCCCSTETSNPNKYQQLYSTRRKMTNLK